MPTLIKLKHMPFVGGEMQGHTFFKSNSFAVYDTLAMVHLKSGKISEARDLMDKAIETLDAGDYSAMEIKLNAARVLLRGNDLVGAKRMATEVLRDSATPAHLQREVRELLVEVRRREAEQE